jgi:hypothetical protein
MPKATPGPTLRTLHRLTLDRIAMNVTKFLYELAMVPDVEIVIPLQPERVRRS